MNFAGTIDETSGTTMTRLIERIVHTDTPGELRLHDDASGRRATVAIRRGRVEDVSFGALTGDEALTAISQVMPWTFEFASDKAGAVPVHPAMVSRRPKARAIVRPAVKAAAVTGELPLEFNAQASPPAAAVTEPAAEATSPELAVLEEPSGGAHESGVAPMADSGPEPSLTDSHRAWIAAPGSPYAIRFGAAGGEFAGEVHADDHDYFRSDYAFLLATAAGIARSLGAGDPLVMVITEPERATGYASIPGGFLGIVGGAGTGVAHVIDFPLPQDS